MHLISIKRGSKNFINYFLDFLLILSIFFTLFSSFILWFVLPRGQGAHFAMCAQSGHGFTGNYYKVLDWPRYVWIDIHNWASVVLLAIVLLHIIMHWKWIVETTRRVKSYITGPVRKVTEQYVAAVILFILFIVDCFTGFVVWLILPRGRLDYYNMIAGEGRTFWGLQRNVWVDIHTWLAITIISVIIIHLILNWSWVVSISKKMLHGISVPFRKKGKQEIM